MLKEHFGALETLEAVK